MTSDAITDLPLAHWRQECRTFPDSALARRYGVSRPTVAQWRKAADIPPWRQCGPPLYAPGYRQVLALFGPHTVLSAREVCLATGYPRPRVNGYLRRLVATGLLVRLGTRWTYRYRLPREEPR